MIINRLLLFFITECLHRFTHSLAVLLQKLDAHGSDLKLIVRDPVEQELNHVGFVLLQIVDVHVLHPMEQDLIELKADVLGPVVHRELQLLDWTLAHEALGSLAAEDISEASERAASDFGMLVLEVVDERGHDAFHVPADAFSHYQSQLRTEGSKLVLHVRVGVVSNLGEHTADSR